MQITTTNAKEVARDMCDTLFARERMLSKQDHENMLIDYAKRLGVIIEDKTMESLWPSDIQVSSIKPPVTILKEQGTFLGRKTSNIVETRVVSKQPKEGFEYDFLIIAPCLGDYSWRILTITHGFELYPVGIISYSLASPQSAETQDEFKDILRDIFATDKVAKVISAIIAQSGDWEN